MAATVESTSRAAGAEALPRRMAAAPPPNRERLFAKARRRSGRVRVLRKTILIGAVGVVAAMVVIAIFDPFGPKSTSLTFSQLSLDGTKVAMAKPRLAGFRSDGQPYVLTAERALQDLKHPTVAELQNLAGDMGSAGGETSRLTADAGVYDSVAQRMHVSTCCCEALTSILRPESIRAANRSRFIWAAARLSTPTGRPLRTTARS
jgi:lipopolysaccharide export system protein LptC